MTPDERKLCNGSEYGHVGERRFFILDEIEPYFGQISGRFDRIVTPGYPGPKGVSTHDANGRNVGWLRLKERARGRRW